MTVSSRTSAWVIIFITATAVSDCISAKAEEAQFGTPKGMEGTRIFKAPEHPFYSGEFHLKGERATLIGSMRDPSP